MNILTRERYNEMSVMAQSLVVEMSKLQEICKMNYSMMPIEINNLYIMK